MSKKGIQAEGAQEACLPQGSDRKYKYVGSLEMSLKKIEVFSFSNSAVPFYTVEGKDGKIAHFGGVRMGRIADLDDVIFEARNEKRFLGSFCLGMMNDFDEHNYDYARARHRCVKEYKFEDGYVCIDVYDNGTPINFFSIGAAMPLYEKGDDGGIILKLNEHVLSNVL